MRTKICAIRKIPAAFFHARSLIEDTFLVGVYFYASRPVGLNCVLGVAVVL